MKAMGEMLNVMLDEKLGKLNQAMTELEAKVAEKTRQMKLQKPPPYQQSTSLHLREPAPPSIQTLTLPQVYHRAAQPPTQVPMDWIGSTPTRSLILPRQPSTCGGSYSAKRRK